METQRDPVCGMTVDPHKAAARVEYGGRTWWFCSEGCRRTFEQEPERYAVPTTGTESGGHRRHG